MRLSGKRIFISAAAQGIGRASALACANEGAHVIATDINDDALKALSTEHKDIETHRLDVRDGKAVASFAAGQAPLDGLFNCAGFVHNGTIMDCSDEDWDFSFDLNVKSMYRTTKAFLPGMLERGWGRVINVASIAGRTGAAYVSAYAASKHAVVGFTRAMAAEVAARGVTFNAVCPGYVDTPMTERSIENVSAKIGLDAAEARRRILATNPQNRLIEADEVAWAIVWLCDPRARGVNGQAIGVDGGAFLG